MLSHLQPVITDRHGVALPVTEEGDTSIQITRETFESGYALWIDATCPAGFAAEANIMSTSGICGGQTTNKRAKTASVAPSAAARFTSRIRSDAPTPVQVYAGTHPLTPIPYIGDFYILPGTPEMTELTFVPI